METTGVAKGNGRTHPKGGRRWLRWISVPATLLVLLLAIDALRRGVTPPLPGANAIAELREVRLGGDPQWVLVRGRNLCNPVVLFLHGGPGMPAMFLAHDFQRSWEEHLTVVHWDRLGAGKSYEAGLAYDSFTVRRTLNDVHELAEWVREHTGVAKMVLVGHSWGSYLGLLAAAERPDLYAAFVGTGQVAGTQTDVARERHRLLRPLAEASGDAALLRAIDSDEPISESVLFQYGGELVGSTSFLPILLTGLQAPEYTLFDVRNVPRGASRVDSRMTGDEVPLDEQVDSVDVPVYFFLGNQDLNTPPALAEDLLEDLTAPQKGVFWFEDAAHFPFWEQPEAFGAALLDIVEELGDIAACF